MQRYSKKREAIYACVCGTGTHPSADWIYQQLRAEFPDLSLGTVYRNLKELKDAGKLASVGVVNGQERFDADLRPHSHLVCERCGAVADLMDLRLPPELLRSAETRSGWQITGSSLRLTGRCPACRETRL